MEQQLLIREVFRLAGGTTVLACDNVTTLGALAGRRVHLMVDGQMRQSIMLASERRMLNQTLRLDQRALETLDIVDVGQEEVQNGRCRLFLD